MIDTKVNVTLSKIDSIEKIKQYLFKDRLYKHILGETIDIGTWNPNLSNAMFFKVMKDSEIIGIFILKEFTSNCVSFHGGLYKYFRGRYTVEVLQEILEDLRKTLNCTFITTICSTNIGAQKIVTNAGFKLKTIIKNGSTNGDILLFGEN